MQTFCSACACFSFSEEDLTAKYQLTEFRKSCKQDTEFSGRFSGYEIGPCLPLRCRFIIIEAFAAERTDLECLKLELSEVKKLL
jgi:hypothetical protein